MIKIEKTVCSGWEAAVRGMRNPLNSWNKSDSSLVTMDSCTHRSIHSLYNSLEYFSELGKNDFDLMQRLAAAGSDHRKFMRFITVTLDITAPLYWWKEFDTYKVGTVANSCSTMHKIHAKEFTLEDFSYEHIMALSLEALKTVIITMNVYRKKYLETKDKRYWWQMIQLLPTSYNQRRTVMLNYEVLRNMYHARKAHKLDEWHVFCEWIETLPYAKELICNG